MRQNVRGLAVSLAFLTVAVGPVAIAQADGGQSIGQPSSAAQTVSQPGECIAETATGQSVIEGSQGQTEGAGAGACTAATPAPAPVIKPVIVGTRPTHSKILRSGKRAVGSTRRHKAH